MVTTKEVNGFYGHRNPTPATVFVYECSDGSRWYVVEGGTMVNKTFDEIEEGVDVEILSDIDVFTWDEPINSLDELIDAIEH